VDGLALDQLSRRLCERTGIGGDEVIYYTALPDGTARMRLVNADGSPRNFPATGCCLAALVLYQRDAEAAPLTTLRVDTDAGWKVLTLAGRSGSKYTFRAAMGAPENITQETLAVAGEHLPVVIMTMANPQCVTLVKDLPDRARFEKLGPALATHPRFKAGTNVEFALVESPKRVRILIWERGVGPTQASGTGACASAVAAAVAGAAGRDVDVEAPGSAARRVAR
jgi:diaminopimelate epimerase